MVALQSTWAAWRWWCQHADGWSPLHFMFYCTFALCVGILLFTPLARHGSRGGGVGSCWEEEFMCRNGERVVVHRQADLHVFYFKGS